LRKALQKIYPQEEVRPMLEFQGVDVLDRRLQNRDDIVRLSLKSTSGEPLYNWWLDENAEVTYDEAHRYMKRYLGAPWGLTDLNLRKYKERRIKKIRDYREMLPTIEIKEILRAHDYKMIKEDLALKTSMKASQLETILKRMEKDRTIACTVSDLPGQF